MNIRDVKGDGKPVKPDVVDQIALAQENGESLDTILRIAQGKLPLYGRRQWLEARRREKPLPGQEDDCISVTELSGEEDDWSHYEDEWPDDEDEWPYDEGDFPEGDIYFPEIELSEEDDDWPDDEEDRFPEEEDERQDGESGPEPQGIVDAKEVQVLLDEIKAEIDQKKEAAMQSVIAVIYDQNNGSNNSRKGA